MIHRLLHNSKISIRVYTGLGIVLVLLTLVATLGFKAIRQLSKEFDNFDYTASNTVLISEINRDALELQRNVLLYTFTGYEGASSNVDILSKDLFDELKTTKNVTSDAEVLATLTQMESHLTGYMQNFSTVIEERRIRKDLLENTISGIVETLDIQLHVHIEDVPFEHRSELVEALSLFYMIQNDTLEYFRNHDSVLVSQAKTDFRDLNAILQQITAAEPPLLDKAKVAKTIQLLEEYESAFIRAVQATRAYLYLVNVVMAGEAAEFVYNSEKLQRISLQNLDTIRTRTSESTNDYQSLSQTISFLALSLGIICSWIIARSIVNPLSKMTATFNELAKGAFKGIVPGLERRDEIGEMAQAANIFREKNHQTEILLEESTQLTQEINQKSKELERSNAEMEQFVYTVSHDLKSPIVTSQGFIGMIRDLAAQGKNEQAFQKLEKLEKANRRMNELITELLNLSRVGRVDLETSELNMNKLMVNLKESITPKVKEHGFTLLIDESLPPLCANKIRTLQAFDNLVNNALKYGEGKAESKIEIGGQDDSDEVRYFVRDYGEGIPQEYHHKIFQLFQRLDTRKEGTGIGLSIVAKIMESHNGRVWVESEKGQGSTFWLSFPKKDMSLN